MPVTYSAVVPLTVCFALTGVLAVPSLLVAQPRTPVPDADVQEVAKKAAGEIYGARFQQAKTTAEKTALAAEMIEAAGRLQNGAPDQYVLLNIAVDIAAGAGDAPTALQAIEALLAESFGPLNFLVSRVRHRALAMRPRRTSRSELLGMRKRVPTPESYPIERRNRCFGAPPRVMVVRGG